MLIDFDDMELVKAALTKMLVENNKWVAIPLVTTPVQSKQLIPFATSNAAATWWIGSYQTLQNDSQHLVPHQYVPIANVLNSINKRLPGEKEEDLDDRKVSTVLNSRKLGPPTMSTDPVEMIDMLCQGNYTLMRRELSIMPIETLDKYFMIKHYRPKEVIQTTVQDVQIIELPNRHNAASEEFFTRASAILFNKKQPHPVELSLVGKFNYMDLHLDRTGTPDLNSGAKLKSASLTGDRMLLQSQLNPFRLHTFSQDMFIRIEPETFQLKYYDAGLKEFDPQKYFGSAGFAGLDNTPFRLKDNRVRKDRTVRGDLDQNGKGINL